MSNIYKYLILSSLSVFTLTACHSDPQPKKYYIVIYQDVKELTSERYSPKVDLDSVEVLTDSMAYWKGIYSVAGSLITEKKVKEIGTPRFYRFRDFDVWDENKVSILPAIPASIKEKGQAFIQQKVAEN